MRYEPSEEYKHLHPLDLDDHEDYYSTEQHAVDALIFLRLRGISVSEIMAEYCVTEARAQAMADYANRRIVEITHRLLDDYDLDRYE